MSRFKKILKFIWDEFIYGGHLISLGEVSIVFTATILLDIKITWQPIAIIYLMTFSALLFNRYKEQDTDALTNIQRTTYLKKYFHFIFAIIFFSVLIPIIILIFYKKIVALIFILSLYLVAILYTKYFKGMTKKIIGLKNISFSLMASLAVVFFAIYYSYPLLNIAFYFVSIFVFLRMIVNTVFLDIKDVKSDEKQNLLTIPILWGQEKTLKFLKWITFLSVVPILFGFFLKKLPGFSLILLFVIPYSFYYFKKSKEIKNFYLTNYVIADLEFILWSIFVLLGKILL